MIYFDPGITLLTHQRPNKAAGTNFLNTRQRPYVAILGPKKVATSRMIDCGGIVYRYLLYYTTFPGDIISVANKILSYAGGPGSIPGVG